MSLGERICKLRTQKNLSQGELADALEVSRQSISKWETNGSVPELDKLIKLSEIFGVTLDELILDKKQQAASEPKVIYVERTEPSSAKKITGVILLCFAVFLWLLVTLFGDILAGLVLALPFAACGLICLLARKNVGLWCVWVVYLFIEIYLRFATGVNWQFVFNPRFYSGGWTIQLIVAWCMLAVFSVLTVVTALRLRNALPGSLRKDAVGTAVSWGVYLITLIVNLLASLVFMNSTSGAGIELTQAQTYQTISTVSGWARSIALVVALVFTVRLITSFLEKQKRK